MGAHFCIALRSFRNGGVSWVLMRRAMLAAAAFVFLAIVLFATGTAPTLARSSEVAVPRQMPLIGADLVNTDPLLPHCWNGSIVPDYGNPGVRARMQEDLPAMRAAGLQTFRIFLYHEHGDPTNSNVVSSSGGRLSEQFRTNLINLLTDIRTAGFSQVTLAFNPWGPNDPTERFSDGSTYDTSLFDENWAFIRDVRSLVRQYGPASTHIDLLNEGASNPSEPTFAQIEDYITRMYANYVDAFGADDVTVSAGYWPGMSGLVQALRASGKPMPRWFDVHPRWAPADELQDLRSTDAELTAKGLSQPLVIGEDKYNDPKAAAAIADFMRTSSRRVVEVMEWPTIIQGSVAQPRCPHPPYRINAYAAALRGASPRVRLTATVGQSGTMSLRTAYGDPVTALEAGLYRIAVADRSRRLGFQLVGPGVRKETGIRFRGTVPWRVRLRAGTYRYQTHPMTSHVRGRIAVLTPG
jgi:hypothetical protein